MFRYVAIAWEREDPGEAAEALRVCRTLQARAGWEAPFQAPGLHVFTAGALPGVNTAYSLHASQGIVLGKLFRQGDLDLPVTGEVVLTAAESARIVRGGGEALTSEFWGRYVAFLRTAGGGVHVLRDPSGALPCYRLRQRGVWIVFSWMEDILAADIGLTLPRVNWDALAAQVLLGELAGHETALDGVAQVLPGEAHELGRDGEHARLLWNAADIARAPNDASPQRAANALRRTVRACTRAWAGCYDGILLRLSGGVDSSIVLGCLSNPDVPARVTCLNYHSAGADSDERGYARLAADQAGRALIERERDAGFRLERVLDVARTPTPGSYIGRIGTSRMDAELAAAYGATALFTGGGGDQLLFEFRRWWPAADYLRLRGIDTGFAAAMMDAARLGRLSVWKTTWLAFADRLRPADLLRDAGTHLTLLRPEAVPRADTLVRFTHPALRSVAGLPAGKLQHVRQLTFPSGYYDPYEREAAPELVNPLLSQPLLELCLRLPTYLLTHGGRGRGLARQAFADELPVEIASRRSKGGMEEHIKAVLLRNLDFARSVLLDGELARRGLLDRARLERALSGRPSALESHIGEFHVYIGIEAWLARWSGQVSGRRS